MPETTTHTSTARIYLPMEVKRRLAGKLTEDEKREYSASHTGINGALEEKIWREAIMPWAAEELGYDPEYTELTVKGDFMETKPRNDDGTFVGATE